MKRRFAGVFAALMVLIMGTTTVFAANSPTGETALVENLNKGVTSVKVGNMSVSTAKVSAADYQAANADKKASNDVIVAMTDITGVTPSGGYYTVVLSVPGIKSTDKVYVMHKRTVGGTYQWEYLNATAGTNTVTVTMDSFSPVYVVKVGETTTTTPGGTTPGGTTPGGTTPGTTTPGSTTPVNGNNNNNTTGDSTSQSNNNNQSNSQTNNQNNPVNVDQNVTVNYPDTTKYEDGYGDGYKDGYNAANKGSSNGGTQKPAAGGVKTSPKTGASLLALPFVAVFSAAGIAACRKRTKH